MDPNASPRALQGAPNLARRPGEKRSAWMARVAERYPQGLDAGTLDYLDGWRTGETEAERREQRRVTLAIRAMVDAAHRAANMARASVGDARAEDMHRRAMARAMALRTLRHVPRPLPAFLRPLGARAMGRPRTARRTRRPVRATSPAGSDGAPPRSTAPAPAGAGGAS